MTFAEGVWNFSAAVYMCYCCKMLLCTCVDIERSMVILFKPDGTGCTRHMHEAASPWGKALSRYPTPHAYGPYSILMGYTICGEKADSDCKIPNFAVAFWQYPQEMVRPLQLLPEHMHAISYCPYPVAFQCFSKRHFANLYVPNVHPTCEVICTGPPPESKLYMCVCMCYLE